MIDELTNYKCSTSFAILSPTSASQTSTVHPLELNSIETSNYGLEESRRSYYRRQTLPRKVSVFGHWIAACQLLTVVLFPLLLLPPPYGRPILYPNSLITATTPASLHERRITHIVSVCHEPIPAEHPQSGYHVHKIRVADSETEDLLIHLPAACQFIHNAMMTPNAIILVHCVQGLSRSACVVAAYCKSFSFLSLSRT